MTTTDTTSDITRRTMLRNVFLGLGAASLPTWVLNEGVARAQAGGAELVVPLGPLGAQDFGPLLEQVVGDNLAVNHQLFSPAGFSARVVMRAGVNPITLNATGTLGHTNPDGGAVYPVADGGWIYTSNSESTPGGVSAIRFSATGAVVDYFRICTATRNNCAGGKTPWGTWITCEEVNGGWAFECDPSGVVPQRRLDAQRGPSGLTGTGASGVIYELLEIGGFNLPVPIRVGPHAEYRIDGGAWTTEEAMLGAGQTLQMRHVSHRPANSVHTTHINVGHVMGHFTTRTSPRP